MIECFKFFFGKENLAQKNWGKRLAGRKILGRKERKKADKGSSTNREEKLHPRSYRPDVR